VNKKRKIDQKKLDPNKLRNKADGVIVGWILLQTYFVPQTGEG
jgi:hypothetical protein